MSFNFKENQKNIAIIAVVVIIVGLFIFAGNGHKNNNQKLNLQSKYESLSTNIEVINKKLDERIVSLEQKYEKQQNTMKQLSGTIKQIQANQQKLSDALQKIEMNIQNINNALTAVNARVTARMNKAGGAIFKKQPVRITSITLAQPKNSQSQQVKKNKNHTQVSYVKLPDASIVEGTVVSGIYAPVTINQWLPTIINVDDAFYGPNDTRVPLKNCKILGKAQGDYTTQRANVQVYEISCVLPNGQARSYKIQGYVTDNRDSAFGIHGALISVTGKYVAGSFLTSFLSGGSSALSQAQTTNTVTSTGATVSSVTGNIAKYTAFSGASSAFNKLASYYQSKLDKLIDMIYVPSGRRVWIVIQKGAVIKGYKPTYYTNTFKGVD